MDQYSLGAEYPQNKVDDNSTTREKILHHATILFAKRGYADISVKEIAAESGIKPASLYSHFKSKEDIWSEVMENVKSLYLLYFKRFDEALKDTKTFKEMIETIFIELGKDVSIFNNYGISLVQTEQFRDEKAAYLQNEVFLKYSIDYIKTCFDRCIEKGWINAFDTETISSVFMHSVLITNNIKVHEDLHNDVPYDATKMFGSLKNLILHFAYTRACSVNKS